MSSGSIRQAEEEALERGNDSQDTLLLAHYVMKDFGVGLVSCLFPADPRMLGQLTPATLCAGTEVQPVAAITTTTTRQGT